jgi:hypothetical protein
LDVLQEVFVDEEGEDFGPFFSFGVGLQGCEVFAHILEHSEFLFTGFVFGVFVDAFFDCGEGGCWIVEGVEEDV